MSASLRLEAGFDKPTNQHSIFFSVLTVDTVGWLVFWLGVKKSIRPVKNE